MFVRGLCSNSDILFLRDMRKALDRLSAAVSPKGSAKNCVFPHSSLWEEITTCSPLYCPHIQWGIMLSSFRVDFLHNLFRILHGRLPSAHLLIYSVIYITLYGEGNGTPLQYSCLENPMDGGAW